MRLTTLFSVLFICFALHDGTFGEYYGKFIGIVQEVDAGIPDHNFHGKLYAIDDTKVAFVNLTYDGQGEAARFWVADQGNPRADETSGKAIPDEHGSSDELKKYDMAHIILTLPGKITDYGGVAIYSPKLSQNFGQVPIPDGFGLPGEQSIGPLTGTKPGINVTDIILIDSATIELKGFHCPCNYTGSDIHFAVGPEKDRADALTKLMDENGKMESLRAYHGETFTLRLPEMKHWNDYEWFTVYDFAGSKPLLGEKEIAKDIAQKLPWHDWEPNKRTTAAAAATTAPAATAPAAPAATAAPKPKRTKATNDGKPATSSPPPSDSSSSSPDAKSEESGGFPTVIAVGVGVGIVVCIATSAYLFWYRSSDKDQPAGGGGAAEGAGTVMGAAA